jgi:pyrroloquinoline quinone (PQQ) biosynthesis protein C
MLAQVPYTVLFWMEKGEPPHFDSWLERIAKALGVKKEDLIARKEE